MAAVNQLVKENFKWSGHAALSPLANVSS